MSEYVPYVNGTYKATHTNHSVEIEALRAKANEIMAANPVPADGQPLMSYEDNLTLRTQVSTLLCAAALLEVHDATGISLDDWTGPRELVENALESVGHDGAFLLNHV